MKKRLIGALLCLALCLAALPAGARAAFTDISDPDVALAAAALQGLGVVSGTSSTTFDPNGSLTRAELCTMVVNAMGLGSQVSTYSRRTLFSDVSPSSWYNGYVNLAYSQGLINGYGDGTFGPEDPVTYGQAATILLRMLGYTSSEIGTVWPMDYTAFADDLGLSEGLTLSDNADLTRGQAALLLYRTLKSHVNGSTQYYYETISGVSATEEAILLDADASYGGGSGLLMACSLDGGGIVYYTQDNSQSSTLEGSLGTLLFNGSGAVVGFLPQEGGTLDLTVGSATASAQSSLARALGISGSSYDITKNGVTADSGDLAQYDVGYYDAASGTLCVSDYRVTGVITAADPSVTAAQTITVAGYTFEVLECAWDTLSDFSLGNRVTLLLTDDCKVAAAYSTSVLTAEMVGVLSEDGSSVTLSGSGITLTASSISADDSLRGSLVRVSSASGSTLSCTSLSAASGRVDLEEGTVAGLELAPSCSIYEWAGAGYVCDLEGNQGAASSDLSAITWTDTLSSSSVSYYHTNSAGQVDVLLLNDVTGNCYSYGRLTVYTGEAGIDLGDSSMHAYNSAGILTNSSGSTSKFLLGLSSSSGSYAGVALGRYSSSYERASSIQSLTRLTGAEASDFFLQSGDWYVEAGGDEYHISDQVQIYLYNADAWLSGESGLTAVLADGYDLTLYYDASGSSQIRVIVAQ